MNLSAPDYHDILDLLKTTIRSARYRAQTTLSYQMLSVYWEIGNTILIKQETNGWGSKVVDRLSADLKTEFPEMKGLSPRNLKYMRAFAEAYPSFTIVQGNPAQLQRHENKEDIIVQGYLAQLSWSHHMTILDKVKSTDERLFYIRQTIKHGWTRDVMAHQIDSVLHKRIGALTHNFDKTIPDEDNELVKQLFKDPYKFDFIDLGNEIKERDLEKALLSQFRKFVLELGQGFAFLGNQYRVTLGDNEYFYDLLFYHTKLKRYIVVELKINEFRPEYKAKMEFYLQLADEQLKDHNDEKSIGLIICRTKDGLVAEYALRDSKMPIGIAEYTTGKMLPKEIVSELPSIEELEIELEREYQELKSPTEKQLDNLKEKLSRLNKPTIEVIANEENLAKIIEQSLITLYENLNKTLGGHIAPLFFSSKFYWQLHNETIDNLPLFIESKGKILDQLRSHSLIYYRYSFNGLLNVGTEDISAEIRIDFLMSTYYYEIIVNQYGQNSFSIKKLYNQQLTTEDILKITEVAEKKIIDTIDQKIDNLLD